jgi:hypothetical protein
VREPREPLQVRIDEEAHHGNRPEPAHQRVELPDGEEEDGERGEAERDDLPRAQLPARQLPAGRAGIRCVDSRVDQAVQPHRERAGADHRHRHPEQVARGRNRADGQERADVREREREDGVLDLDEAREADGQRRAPLGGVGSRRAKPGSAAACRR